MKVRFNTNLGTSDAKTLGLDAEKCCKGFVVDVSTEVADRLCKEGKYGGSVASRVDASEARAADKAPAKTDK